MGLVRKCLSEQGMVVVEGLVPHEVWDKACQDLMSWLEAGIHGFRATDRTTWHLFSNEHVTMSPDLLGMNSGPICLPCSSAKTKGPSKCAKVL